MSLHMLNWRMSSVTLYCYIYIGLGLGLRIYMSTFHHWLLTIGHYKYYNFYNFIINNNNHHGHLIDILNTKKVLMCLMKLSPNLQTIENV